MLGVPEALTRVLASVEPVAPTSVLVRDAAGCVLAEEVRAPHPMPRFDNSAMDGFAIKAADARSVPVSLTLIGEVRAGDPGEQPVEAGQAAPIMTGAPLPPGADAVVPVEHTETTGSVVTILKEAQPAQHVRRAGEDVSTGALLMHPGIELGPGEVALLASVGHSPVLVRAAPRVAVVVTGDELVAPEESPGPGQIRDSNSLALATLVREAGAVPAPAPRVGDDLASTVSALAEAAKNSDLVVSSGGVAVGRYDFVKEAVEELGRIDMWRVAMQPGKPVVLGSIGQTPFLGLPGNPVSIHVSFEQFVRPAIRKLRGCRDLLRPRIRARLTTQLSKRAGRQHFVRVRLTMGPDGWEATPTGPQGSHIQTSLVDVHGVALFDAESERLEAGSEVVVEVWSLPGRRP